jgi:hypothetical protein
VSSKTRIFLAGVGFISWYRPPCAGAAKTLF